MLTQKEKKCTKKGNTCQTAIITTFTAEWSCTYWFQRTIATPITENECDKIIVNFNLSIFNDSCKNYREWSKWGCFSIVSRWSVEYYCWNARLEWRWRCHRTVSYFSNIRYIVVFQKKDQEVHNHSLLLNDDFSIKKQKRKLFSRGYVLIKVGNLQKSPKFCYLIWSDIFFQGAMFIVFAKCSRVYVYSRGYVYSGV